MKKGLHHYRSGELSWIFTTSKPHQRTYIVEIMQNSWIIANSILHVAKAHHIICMSQETYIGFLPYMDARVLSHFTCSLSESYDMKEILSLLSVLFSKTHSRSPWPSLQSLCLPPFIVPYWKNETWPVCVEPRILRFHLPERRKPGNAPRTLCLLECLSQVE